MWHGFFDDRQKKAFVALAYKVALADHWVPASEDDFFKKLCAKLGVEAAVPPESLLGPSDVRPFDGRPAQIAVVFDLLCLAYSDDHFHADEFEVLKDIVDRFGLTAMEFAAIQNLARQQIVLRQELAAAADASDDRP